MAETILSIKKLNITRNTKELFRNFNLCLKKGDIVGIFAPSGSGKSTLVDFILKNYIPDSQAEMQQKENLRISVCFQESRLIESQSVIKNVIIPIETELGKKTAYKKALEYIDKVGLLYRIKNKVTELSGGEKQRVSLARALCYSAELMLLDEPFQSQDMITQKKLMKITKEVIDKENRTVILISHDMEEIRFFTDNIITEKDFIL